MSTEEFFALYRGIADSSSDPGFGLKLGTEERIERYDPIKIAALSARSFRDAVERLSRYKHVEMTVHLGALGACEAPTGPNLLRFPAPRPHSDVLRDVNDV